MSHINYNHLYYFWHVYKEGSVVGAAEALYLTPQTITGQIRALEERLQGKLFKRKGRGLEPSELGELVYRYADKMFTLSQEMLDIVNPTIAAPNPRGAYSWSEAAPVRLPSPKFPPRRELGAQHSPKGTLEYIIPATKLGKKRTKP